MAETPDNKPTDDLSALAWVHSELRRSIDTAHKALRRYLKDSETAARSDLDAVDPAALRSARTQLHQGVGALELVGLPAAARLLRASEAAVQRMLARPHLVNEKSVHTVEKASFALLDYLGRMLAGKSVSPVGLFPQYAAVQTLAGADRVHPADLWEADFSWHDLPAEAVVQSRAADDSARSSMEAIVLRLMRQPDPGAWTRLSDLCAQIAAGVSGHAATLWQLAAAFAEAEAAGLLPRGDLYTKRMAARLLAQLRLSARQQDEPSERLAQDLLFFCAHARRSDQATPRLDAVRRIWRLPAPPPVDYESEYLGRFDPAWIAQARKRVASAKDVWSAVAGGESHRLSGLNEQVALLGDSVDRLFPSGAVLTRAMQDTATKVLAEGGNLPAPLAMEVATSVLYLDATLEDGELDQADLGERLRRLAQRINDVRGGAEPQPLEPWMEELYRRVSDRQTMGSVVHELRASLSEIEKQIDQYFRDPSQRELLIPVPKQLSAMRGVLSVLGMDQASQAVLHMRDAVDALAQTEVDPQQVVKAGTFDRLADNLGALSFLIDMLSVQPQLAKSLFRFDPVEGSFSAVMGQRERLSAFGGLDEVPQPTPLVDEARALAERVSLEPQADHHAAFEVLGQRALAADLPGVAGVVSSAQRALAAATDAQSREAVGTELAQAVQQLLPPSPPPVAPVQAPLPSGVTDLEEDAEMREIFLEEAQEVLAGAGAAMQSLADQPEDVAELTTVRRAFHTLKGSSRMVGLRDYGEAAWACEQLYNARLALSPRMDADLDAFTRDALAHLAAWTDAIARGDASRHHAAPIVNAADSLRLRGQRLPIGPVPDAAAAAPAGLPAGDLPVLDTAAPPVASDLPELNLAWDVPATPPAAEPAASAEPAEPAEPVPLSLDDEPPAFELLPEAATASLSERVPGLPQAADLDLGLPAQGQTEAAPVDVDAPDFALELGDATDFEIHGLDAGQAEAAKGPHPEQPDLAEVIELDFGAFEGAQDAQTEAPVPEATAAPAAATVQAPATDAQDLGALLFGEVTQALEPSVTPDSPAAAPPEIEPQHLQLDLAAPSAAAAEPADVDLDLEEVTTAAPADIAPVLAVPADLGVDAMLDEAAVTPEPEPLPEPDVATGGPAASDDGDLSFDLGLEDLSAPAQALAPTSTDAPGPAADVPVVPAAAAEPATTSFDDEESGDKLRVIGDLRIPIPLFNIYLNEADELSRRLCTELAEWGLEHDRRPVPESAVVLAHSLAGSSATVGYRDLSGLARALEHVLIRSAALGVGRADEPALFNEAADEIRRLLHQFAAGFLRPLVQGLRERLAEHERRLALLAAERVDSVSGADLEDALEAAEQSQSMPLDEPAAPALETADLPAAGVDDEALAPTASPVGSDDALHAPEPASTALPDAATRADAQVPLAAVPQAVTRFAALDDQPDSTPAAHPAHTEALDDDDEDIEAVDQIDTELFPIFEEEAEELLPQLLSRLRDWALHPSDADAPSACMRTLHTFKGGARLSGAMRLGEMAHRLESAVERLATDSDSLPEQIERLQARADLMVAAYEALRKPSSVPTPAPVAAPAQPVPVDLPATWVDQPTASAADALALTGTPEGGSPAPADGEGLAAATPEVRIDWSRFNDQRLQQPAVTERVPGGAHAVRVRASLLDRLVNHAGEVSITRARIDADVTQLQGAVNDLTDNLDRLRTQLREIELQAESQISSRIEAAKAASQAFDPLEMDRFTRFQELTRMMAESVNDVATVQRSVQRTLQSTEDQLAAQARLTRELQDDLLRTRMVEFDSLSDRLYRVVRQAAKDSGKQVRLDIVGGSIEVDRGVLERMIGPFEHLLRNSVAHGIEAPAERQASGKDPTGEVRVTVTQEGNEIGVVCRDDGAGFDLARIRQRAEERGLLQPGQAAGDAELANMIFLPGFTTSKEVTELAGRGVGLDVVRSEVNAMGGRIETASTPGQGSSFKLVLPLTTAVTQVVMLRCAELEVAVPSTLVEVVKRVPTAQVERAYAQGGFDLGDQVLPFFWLGGLLQHSARGPAVGRSQLVVVVRSAAQRVALHVDEVQGNQEVVVKHVGPQLARLPGLAGVTLLPSGAVALIYNPVALAALFGEAAQRRAMGAPPALVDESAPAEAEAPDVALAPLVLVVDDSLTVRRVTQRLLAREGYRVALAKDGMDALERLAEERPAIMLSDIEMPRMDGFDLVRNVRSDARLADLPVVMITSRIAQKHRDYATELGVDHYLGKPYSEDELLHLVARYAGTPALV